MTDNKITPEFLAQMHAAMRGNRFGLKKPTHKHPGRKRSISVGMASEHTASSSVMPGSSAQPVATLAKNIDVSLAESVGQTTAEAAADMGVGVSQATPAATQGAVEPAGGEKKEEGNDLLDKVFESEIEQVENKLFDPLLSKALPPIENGIFEVKDVQDRVLQKTPYVNGKVHGEVQLFDTEGKLAQTYVCVEDVKQGPMRYFDTAGNLTHEVLYEKDKRQGKGTFYVNGAKVAEITFQEDVMTGPAIYYAMEGYISAAAIYQNNALEGELRCFDAQQRLIKTLNYHQGQLRGETITYYPGGVKIFEKMSYMDNVPVDKQVQFYEDGTILSIREYDKGKLVKERFYDSKGKELSKPEGEKIINLFPHIPNFKK